MTNTYSQLIKKEEKKLLHLARKHPDFLSKIGGKNPNHFDLIAMACQLGFDRKGKSASFVSRARFVSEKLGIPYEVNKPVRAIKAKREFRVYEAVDKPKYNFANSPDFLSSYEWRKVRMVALTRYGAKCQCCGATPSTGAVMNVDHIKPRLIYPELALNVDNLQILCHECNHGKGNWDMTDWRFENREAMDSLEEQNLAHFKSI